MTTQAATIEKELSIEELEAILKQKVNERNKLKERERKQYEKGRDTEIEVLINEAIQLTERLQNFKTRCHDIMQRQEVKLRDYGDIRSNSKGGFSITHSDGLRRVTRRRDTVPNWDERGEKGMDLVKDFLHTTVKKRDKDLFEILISFLEKNKAGDLEYGRVMALLSHRKKFSDNRWLEGLRLIEESFSINFRQFAYEFKTRNEAGKWENHTLNFSSL